VAPRLRSPFAAADNRLLDERITRSMDTLLTILFIAAVGWALYRYGKRIGSRQGFGAGRRRRRRRR